MLDMSSAHNRNRVPEGVPTGGQFATERRTESDTPTLAQAPIEDPLGRHYDPDSVEDFEVPGHPYIDFVQVEDREAIWDDDAEDYEDGQMRATAIVRVNLHEHDLGDGFADMSPAEKDEWLDEHHIDVEQYFDAHHGTRNLDKTDFGTGPDEFGPWSNRSMEFTAKVPTGSTGHDIVRALEERTQAGRVHDFDAAGLRAHLAGEPYPAPEESPPKAAHRQRMTPWRDTITDRHPDAVGTLIGRDPDTGAPRVAGVYRDGGDLIVSRDEIQQDGRLAAACRQVEEDADWEQMAENTELGGDGLVVWEEVGGRVDPDQDVHVDLFDRG